MALSGAATTVDPSSALAPQPRWCSWLDGGDPPPPPDRGDAFALRCRSGEPQVEAGGAAGRYYAERLVGQLRLLHPDGLPDLDVVDWPDLEHRGVTLDCSRHRVPTVESLEATFELMGGLRLNHVELYLETTYRHPGHQDVWGGRDAYSAEDVERLRRAAARHHIELIGQQNSLGHMEGWLASPRHAHLAALAGGYTTPDGSCHEPPATLEPTDPAAWELVAELVTNMARAFPAERIHVGLDEPLDLNPAMWDAIFDVPGAEAPWAGVDNGSFCVPLPPDRLDQYLDWVHRLRALPALAGRDMLMWADVVAPHPGILDRLPQGVTLVEWGYEADHPFDQRCGRIAAAGRPFWVAPGTSGWSALGGRVHNMVANIDAAARAAAHHGAHGLLITTWGANPAVGDWPGVVWAAATAWNAARRPDPAGALDLTVAGVAGGGLGDAWMALGQVSDPVVPTIPETTTASEMFRSGGMAGIGLALKGMTVDQLDAVDARLERIGTALAGAPPGHWRDELAWMRDALAWGVAATRFRLSWDGAPQAEELRERHGRLCAEHDRLWHTGNRHGGYDIVAAELAATLGGI